MAHFGMKLAVRKGEESRNYEVATVAEANDPSPPPADRAGAAADV